MGVVNQSSTGRTVGTLVKFRGPKGIFSHKLPRLVQVSQLYALAFRGMKGRCPRFDLIYLGERMKPESSIALQWDPTIDISVSETTAARAGFEELSLIKVFKSWKPTRTAMNYWVPKNTTNTVASIIFRYWRYLEERPYSYSDVEYDAQVWTDISYRGDGSITGTPQDEWESISTFLTPWRATGKLENEDPYPNEEGDEDEDEDEELEGTGDHPLVFKVLMIGRSSQSAWAAMRAKKLGSLTRVSSFNLRLSSEGCPSVVGVVLKQNWPDVRIKAYIRIFHQQDDCL